MTRKTKKLYLRRSKGKLTFVLVSGKHKVRKAGPAKRAKTARRKRTGRSSRPIEAMVGQGAANAAPRALNAQERADLVAYLVFAEKMDPADAFEWTQRVWCAAFDDYGTDSPGYAGKVIVALWPAAPEAIQSFIYRGAQLVLAGSSTW